MLQVTKRELAHAIRWALDLHHDPGVTRHAEIWKQLAHSANPQDRQLLNDVSRLLTGIVEEAVRWRLELPLGSGPLSQDRDGLEQLWMAISNWMRGDSTRQACIQQLLDQAVPSAAASPPPQAAVPARTPRPAAPVLDPRPAIPAVPATALPTERVLPIEPVAPPEVPPPAEPPRPVVAGSGWLYRPVPESEPDRHPESGKIAQELGEGRLLVGARVRGKKHKHEATNCDDWFEFGQAGAWTVIAVADGAGSRKLSRLGARVSCERAVAFLTGALADVQPAADWPSVEALLGRDVTGRDFIEPGLVMARNCLHQAFEEAYAAVAARAGSLRGSEPHERLLGRPVAVEDLSATLLVALHRALRIGGVRQSLVLACQIGDGAVAAVDRRANIHLLGQADSGEFSGETDFLTSRRLLEAASLQRRTVILAAPLRVLFVMTDGVADDYFPPDPGLARLYADLVLNGVLPHPPEAGPPRSANGATEIDPSDGRLDLEVQVATASGPVTVRLRSAAAYASALHFRPEEVAASADLLRAGSRGSPLLQLPSFEVRLLQWLDAYHVRGSFDDRTLVVLHCGKDG